VPHCRLKTHIRGRQVILSIGRHCRGAWEPERARRKATKLLGLNREAERATDKAAPALAELAPRHMREYAQRPKNPRMIEEDREALLYLLPALCHLQVRAIGKRSVARFQSSLHLSPVAAKIAIPRGATGCGPSRRCRRGWRLRRS